MQTLDVSVNPLLSGPLPPAYSTMTALSNLQLYGGVLNGTLPEAWSEMTALTMLLLENSQLTGVESVKCVEI